jgi:predicted dehydrogenase
MADVNIAIIGCGGLARVHAECLRKIPGARTIAYCDKVSEAAEGMLRDFGGDEATTDVERILANRKVNAVYVCTRHDSHAALAIAAARAGKHILIEKPLALKLEDCQAVADAVRRAGVQLMPAFKMRYYPLIQRARAFIPRPQVIVGQMMDDRWGDDVWPQDPVQGGANVHSQGCHMTDIIRHVAGAEPKAIWAAGGAMTHPGHPCIDQCVAAIQFENGAVASWIQGDVSIGAFTSKFFLELFGDGKSVQLYNRFKTATFKDGDKTWVEERPEEEGFMLENREFVEALTSGRAPQISVDDGIQATRMVLAADASIRSGNIQRLGAASTVAAGGRPHSA